MAEMNKEVNEMRDKLMEQVEIIVMRQNSVEPVKKVETF
jgi:hypothetical protein